MFALYRYCISNFEAGLNLQPPFPLEYNQLIELFSWNVHRKSKVNITFDVL